ncbi:NAD(P)/FAD-dependent oxidoreductase [Thermoleophilia bacterium SCSIO 60948]|nr:NAD(P)/FAD-dependent oxidoreductase [Thermoleophilia bacterium SCSIO 60948]
MPNSRPPKRSIVLGAGPAGLTAGLLLARRGARPLVLEADSQVGGLARTVVRDGYRFDLGGHRFFTKSAEVEALWHEVLGDELLERPRLSRIHWRGRFIEYPLALGDVVRKVGPGELARCGASYARASLTPRRGEAETFEDWVTARFGRRLFELFFRSYTEKVWGVPTSEIRAEWAAQRIRDLSFSRAVRAAITGDGGEVRSLIERFLYPRLGPGQMWEAMAAEIESLGGEVRTGAPVERLRIGDHLHSVEVGGESIAAGGVISSLPLRATVEMASPGVAPETLAAARGLHYRDFITVALIVDGAEPFPDNWIYVHEPGVEVGRIQNFRAWSPAMVPEAGRSCLGLEYFCFKTDPIWSRPDAELIELATAEIARLGLVDRERVVGGHVVRVPAAYPIYDSDYSERVATIRAWLDRIPNLQQVGRNGLHRYNNSDHSMLTAIRAVENQLDGAGHDIWAVNADSVYHEEERPGEDAADPEQPYLRPPRPPESGELDDERERVAQSIA